MIKFEIQWWGLLLLILGIGACDLLGDNPQESADSVNDSSPWEITYHQQIKPMMASHCTACHTVGGFAPFPLENYNQVHYYREFIRFVINNRIMPPWGAEEGGECNQHYENSLWLSDEQLATFNAWADDGGPEGFPTDPIPPVQNGLTLVDPEYALSIGGPYTSDAVPGVDDFHSFVVENPINEDRVISALDFVEAIPNTVHHAQIYTCLTSVCATAVRRADNLITPNVVGFGELPDGGAMAIPDLARIATWTPGAGATVFPDGTGVLVRAGMPFLLNLHLSVATGPIPPITGNLVFNVSPLGTAAQLITMKDFLAHFCTVDPDTDLPTGPCIDPGQSLEIVRTRPMYNPGEALVPQDIYIVQPHMHLTGREISSKIIHADGSESCLVNVPKYQFEWQRTYRFADGPIRVNPGDLIQWRCLFHNDVFPYTVYPGQRSNDEMCLMMLYRVVDP